MTDKQKPSQEDADAQGKRSAYQKLGEASAIFNMLIAVIFLSLPLTRPVFESLLGFQRDKIEQEYSIRRNAERIAKLESDLAALTERLLPRTPAK